METNRYLKIYLQDHHAGAVAGTELARRARNSNKDNEFGAYLETFLADVKTSRGALEDLMRRLGAPQSRSKTIAAWAAEKIGRLKLNGEVTTYSDLSRLLELEGLCLGVEGQLSLWRALKQVESSDPRLSLTDFDHLIAVAARHREELERHREKAAGIAFGGAQ